MSEKELFILCHFILFPLLIAVARWKDTIARFWPMMLLFFLGFVGEYSVWFSVQNRASWQPFNNLYILADSLLIPIQFAVWGFLSRRFLFFAILLPLLAAWFYFHLWPGSLYFISAYYRVAYSFVILLLTISSINYLLIHTRYSVNRNPIFLFLAGFLVFYSYQLIYETAYAFSMVAEPHWNILLNRTFALINFACNILYGIAVCCIPADPARRWKQL